MSNKKINAKKGTTRRSATAKGRHAQTQPFPSLWIVLGVVALVGAVIAGVILFTGDDSDSNADNQSQNTSQSIENTDTQENSSDVAINTSNALPSEISVSEAQQLRSEGVLVVDVREQYEWDEYHVPGAVLIPLGQLSNRLDELPKDQEIIVMCNSGNRSQDGRDILQDAGFSSVTSMDGGIQAWMGAGYETCYDGSC